MKATSGAATNINSASGEVYDAGTGSNTNTLSGNASAYALNAENQTVDTAGHTLTLGDGTAGHQAGVILNGGSIISSSGSGVLNFGNNEGVIYTSSAGTPAISARIAGSDGATFFGPGTLDLTGTNTNLTGGLNVNQGTVNVTSGANLGATGNTITLDSGTLQFSNSFSTNTSDCQASLKSRHVTSLQMPPFWRGADSVRKLPGCSPVGACGCRIGSQWRNIRQSWDLRD